MRLKEINKKYEELVNDFIELSDKLNVKIVHDKGDFNGDNCLLFSDNFIVINNAICKNMWRHIRSSPRSICSKESQSNHIYIIKM